MTIRKLPNSKLVSLVIVNHNGKENTLEFIESLRKTDYPNYEIVLVDNGSADGSVESVKRKFPYVKVVETGRNLGCAEGLNVGVKKSKGEYIVLLNNDMIANQSEWLSKLVEVAESDKNIGVVQFAILYANKPDVIDSIGLLERNRILKIIIPYFVLGKNKGNLNEFQKIIDITGGVGLVKREVLNKVGFLDKKMFVYFEEYDFCYRVKKAGYRVVSVTTSKIWHKGSGTIKKQSYFSIYHSYKNRIRFMLKNYDIITNIFAMQFNFVYYIFMIVYYAIKNRFDLSKAIRDGIVWNLKNWRDYI